MVSSSRSKSLAEKIADQEDPAPQDYDPEDIENYGSSDESTDQDKPDGREHYEAVGYVQLVCANEI
jgi:protein AATF/BFR2